MPLIPNFPPELLAEHRDWHRARHWQMMNPPPGYGFEFLEYHRSFIGRALQWYMASGMDPRLVTPWLSVPEPVRHSYCYDRAAEHRVANRPETFRSADELGRFILTSGLHSCMHEQSALLFGEPELNDFDLATRYTTFYRLHGLIDQWYRNWEGLVRFRDGITHWCGRFVSSAEEVLYYRTEDATWWLGVPQSAGPTDARGTRLEWSMAGHSRMFGPLDDGRPIRIQDIDGDGCGEIVFYDESAGKWRKGKLDGGRIRWELA